MIIKLWIKLWIPKEPWHHVCFFVYNFSSIEALSDFSSIEALSISFGGNYIDRYTGKTKENPSYSSLRIKSVFMRA